MLYVRDLCKLFEVPEKTVLRWIREEQLPAYRFAEQFCFNRSDIATWATARGRSLPESFWKETERSPFRLGDALRNGGVHHDLGSDDRRATMRAVVDSMPLPSDTDRDVLVDHLHAHEVMVATHDHDGIAIPNPKTPIALHVDSPLVSLCFLTQPLCFGGEGSQPVHTVFSVVAPTARVHLGMISRIAHCLHDPAVRRAIRARASRDEILSAIDAVEGRMEALPQASTASS